MRAVHDFSFLGMYFTKSSYNSGVFFSQKALPMLNYKKQKNSPSIVLALYTEEIQEHTFSLD